MNYTEAKQYLARHGQEHLLHFYDTLTPPQQESLLAQIAGLGLERPQFRDRNALTQKRGEFAPLGALTIEEIRKKRGKVPGDRAACHSGGKGGSCAARRRTGLTAGL